MKALYNKEKNLLIEQPEMENPDKYGGWYEQNQTGQQQYLSDTKKYQEQLSLCKTYQVRGEVKWEDGQIVVPGADYITDVEYVNYEPGDRKTVIVAIPVVENKKEDLKEKITAILKNDIHYSAQLETHVIHGAIEKLCDLFVGKEVTEVNPDIKKLIEDAAYLEEIYPKKYGSGTRDGYNTMMLYEINSERSECFEKGAWFGYNLAKEQFSISKK